MRNLISSINELETIGKEYQKINEPSHLALTHGPPTQAIP